MRYEDTISIPDAVKHLGITRQSIYKAIDRGKIRIVGEVAGRKLLDRGDVEKYKPRQKRLEANRQRKERGEGAQG